MADTLQTRTAVLLLAFLQLSYAGNGVVGLITLAFGIAGVIGGVVIYKYILKRYKRDSDEHQLPDEVELQDVPAGHTYEQVESSAPVRTEDPRPYELAVSERPPIPVPYDPEEMGFTVTAHAQDLPAAEQELVTPNPHYIPVDEKQGSGDPEYENHGLTKFKDHSHGAYSSVPDGGGTSLEDAVNFYDREEIEGELIDEIDYQNVTVVLTRVKNDEKYRRNPQEDIFQRGMATATVEWEGNGLKLDKEETSFFQNTESSEELTSLNNKPELTDLNEVYDDVSKIPSTAMYQNFGPGQGDGVRVDSDESLNDDTQKLNHGTQEAADDDIDEYEDFDGVQELYINTPSVHMRAAKDEVELDYENMSPDQFRT